MFDTGRGGGSGCDHAVESNPEGPERRQYTLKGIEADTIALMRDAARKDGMKIGSWVSIRMKEAAERSLSLNSKPSFERTEVRPNPDELVQLVERLYLVVRENRNSDDERLGRIERELHEITSIQRSLLASLLAQRDQAGRPASDFSQMIGMSGIL